MKRTLALVVMGVSALVGMLLVGACVWFVLVIGADGVSTTSLGTVTSSPQARAVVIEVDRVTTQGSLRGLGQVELVASSPGRDAIALATGDRSVVDAQLDGVAYDAASVDGVTWTTAPVPGGARVPTWDARDWPRRSVGAAPALAVTDKDVIVLGRADGRSGVSADLALVWRADAARGLLPWVLGAGVLLLVVAGVFGGLAVRRR